MRLFPAVLVFLGVLGLFLGVIFWVKANNTQEESGNILLPLQKAIIYPKKSHFFHTFSVSLRKGDTLLYLQNVAKGIDTSTISLTGLGEYASYTIQYAKNEKVFQKNHIIHALRDSIFFLKDTLENLQFAQNTLIKSQEFLKFNAPTSLEHFSKEKIQELYSFLHQKDLDNQKQKRILTRTEKYLKEKLATIEEKIAFYENSNANANTMLALRVHLNESFEGELQLQYHTARMYWTPNYKIQTSEKDSLLRMEFLGKITQKTGVIFQKTQTFLATKPFQESNFAKEKGISLVPDSIFKKKQQNTNNAQDNSENTNLPAWKHEILLSLSPKMDTNLVFFAQSTKKKYTLLLHASQNANLHKVAKWENWVFEKALPGQAEIFVENQKTETIFLSPHHTNIHIRLSQDVRLQANYSPFLRKENQKIEGKNELKTDSISRQIQQHYTQGFNVQIHNISKDTLNIEVFETPPIVQHTALKMDFAKNPNFFPEQNVFVWNINLKPNEKKEIQGSWALFFPKNFVLVQ